MGAGITVKTDGDVKALFTATRYQVQGLEGGGRLGVLRSAEGVVAEIALVDVGLPQDETNWIAATPREWRAIIRAVTGFLDEERLKSLVKENEEE